jgi:hypothetical protein
LPNDHSNLNLYNVNFQRRQWKELFLKDKYSIYYLLLIYIFYCLVVNTIMSDKLLTNFSNYKDKTNIFYYPKIPAFQEFPRNFFRVDFLGNIKKYINYLLAW